MKVQPMIVWRCLVLAALTCATAGCGYHLRPPFETRIRTVYVPMFKTTQFRHDLNLQLTELIQKEIERRTPYKVVGSREGADATLDGQIVWTDKNLMVENPNNFPREVMGTMTVYVRLTDNTTGETVKEQNLAPVPVNETTAFFSELGETSQLGWYKAMDKVARDVVNMMEERW